MIVEFTKQGQINRGTRRGDTLIQLLSDPSIKRVLESGTFNGQGTTRLVYEELKDREDAYFLSLETVDWLYEESKELYKNVPWIDIQRKTLVGPEDIRFDESLKKFLQAQTGWTDEDLKHAIEEEKENASNCDRLDISKCQYDLCILDGGEFFGWTEFAKVEKNTRYVYLDDIFVNKNHITYNYCKEEYEEIVSGREGNGFAIFKLR